MSFFNNIVPQGPLIPGTIKLESFQSNTVDIGEYIGQSTGSITNLVSVSRTSPFINFLGNGSHINFRVLPFESLDFMEPSVDGSISVNIPGAGDTFTVSSDGTYKLLLSVSVSSASDYGDILFGAVVNNSPVPIIFAGDSSNYGTIGICVSGILNLSLLDGDMLQIVGYKPSSGNVSVDLIGSNSLVAIGGPVIPTTVSLRKL
jgi:hypothetical protein